MGTGRFFLDGFRIAFHFATMIFLAAAPCLALYLAYRRFFRRALFAASSLFSLILYYHFQLAYGPGLDTQDACQHVGPEGSPVQMEDIPHLVLVCRNAKGELVDMIPWWVTIVMWAALIWVLVALYLAIRSPRQGKTQTAED